MKNNLKCVLKQILLKHFKQICEYSYLFSINLDFNFFVVLKLFMIISTLPNSY